MAVAWSGQFTFDFFIFLFILLLSLHIRQERSWSISNILLRDGTSFELDLPLKLTRMDC